MIQAIEAPGNARSSIMSSGRAFPKVERGAKYASIYARIGGSLAQLQPNSQTLTDQVDEELKNPDRASIHQLASEELKSPSKKMSMQPASRRTEVGPDNGPRILDKPEGDGTASKYVRMSAANETQSKIAKAPSSPTEPPTKEESKSVGHRVKPDADVRSRRGADAVPVTKIGPVTSGDVKSISRPGNPILALSGAKRGGLLRTSTPKRAYVLRQTKQDVPAQVSRALAQVVSQGGGNTTLKLNPHSLGSVRVDIQMNYGVARVKLRANNDVAQKMLSSGVKSLRLALERTGVVVDSLQVTQTENQTERTLPDQHAMNERSNMSNFANAKEKREPQDEHSRNRGGQIETEQTDSFQGEPQVESQMHQCVAGEWHLDTLA